MWLERSKVGSYINIWSKSSNNNNKKKFINNIQNNVGSEVWLKWEGAKWEESKGPNLVIIVFIGSRCGCSSFQTKWLQNSSSSSVPSTTTTKRRRSSTSTTSTATAWPFATTGSHFRTNVFSDSVWVWLTAFCSLVFLLQCWMNLFLFRSTTTHLRVMCDEEGTHSLTHIFHFFSLCLFVLVKPFLFF